MARITTGEDFGQRVAQPTRFNEVATPRAAFGVAGALEAAGMRQQQEEQRLARERAAAEQDVLSAREAADRAQATSQLGFLRDKLGDLAGEIDEGIQTGGVDKTQARQQWADRAQQVLADALPGVPEAYR